jgi:hypothetical protein
MFSGFRVFVMKNKRRSIMEIWEVEEEHLIALIYEINRLGQSMLGFGEQVYGPYYSSRLAEITLNMLGLEGTATEISGGDPAGNARGIGEGPEGFDAGPYSYLFYSEVFLNENLLAGILAGIRQNSGSFYKTRARATETESSVVWIIEERFIMDLIKEVHRLGRAMGRLEGDAWSEYFSTDLPDIILKMLGIPESYSGIPYEDLPELFKDGDDYDSTATNEGSENERPKNPAAYSRAYDYDMFNYAMGDGTIKKYLDYTREHLDEYRRIRAEQIKLGNKLHEPDAYDALYDKLIEGVKSGKIRPDQPENDKSE